MTIFVIDIDPTLLFICPLFLFLAHYGAKNSLEIYSGKGQE